MWQLSNDFYCAIGRITVGSAQLDQILSGIVSRLLDSKRAEIVIAGQPFSYLDQAARALGALLEPGLTSTLNELLVEARELHQERDLVVHGVWLPHKEDILRYIDDVDFEATRHIAARPRRWKDQLHGRIVTLDEIRQLASDIEGLSAKLQKFLDDYI